ncbi:MAG: DUF4393 domain-containing protein [Saprospiraceae bacterium]|nr:DUF4393 domain-containing protein [Saprospiraceae bacterium]MBK9630995.1 DUF4393 domain-containing protein [Saprospiraceae bacterium]
MPNIEKIIENLNIPKQILDKSESLLKTLFGPSFEEFGGIIGDQVKLRRFNNQIRIFSKAQAKLLEHKIDPQKVSLKVLVPLIELSSLEEEEGLQEKWANLSAHIIGGNKEIIFQQNCISILNKLSSEEAKLLDELHKQFNNSRLERYRKDQNDIEQAQNLFPELKHLLPKSLDNYAFEKISFNISHLSKSMSINIRELEFNISNLISLGLLKWQTNVDVEATKSSEDPENNEIDVDVQVFNNNTFIFTSIGDRFVKICKE